MPYKHIGKRYISILTILLAAFVLAAFGLAYRAYFVSAQEGLKDVILGINPYQAEKRKRIHRLGDVLVRPTTLPFIQNVDTIVFIQRSDQVEQPITSYFDYQISNFSLEANREGVKLLEKSDAIVDEILVTELVNVEYISLFAQNFPQASITTLIVPDQATSEEYQQYVSILAPQIDDNTLIFVSASLSDFPLGKVRQMRNRATMSAIESKNLKRLENIETADRDIITGMINGCQSYECTLLLSMEGTYELVTSDIVSQRSVSMLYFGDLMLDRGVENVMKNSGPDSLFADLHEDGMNFFEGVDIVTANLEGPFANSRRATSKEIAFRFDPQYIPMLKDNHFNIFTLANNHTTDMSLKGDEESRENLDEHGIEYYGHQLRESFDDSVFIKSVGDTKVAFVGFDDTILSLNISKVLPVIQKAREQADFVVVNVHWGQEYKLVSNQRQRTLARAFIDAGADTVVGHHPHVVQEIEVYKNKPIFYSLGNFVFDQYFSQETQQGLGVGLVLSESFIDVTLLPVVANQSKLSSMRGEELKIFLAELEERSRLTDEVSFEGVMFGLPQR